MLVETLIEVPCDHRIIDVINACSLIDSSSASILNSIDHADALDDDVDEMCDEMIASLHAIMARVMVLVKDEHDERISHVLHETIVWCSQRAACLNALISSRDRTEERHSN